MSTAPGSRTQAINSFCRGCIVDELSAGTWREQVAACSAVNCPLYPFRPMPRSCQGTGELAALCAKLDETNRARSRR